MKENNHFKDWAKGYMCLYKSVLLVGVDSYGDGYAETDTQKWGLHFHRPEWANMKWTRADQGERERGNAN